MSRSIRAAATAFAIAAAVYVLVLLATAALARIVTPDLAWSMIVPAAGAMLAFFSAALGAGMGGGFVSRRIPAVVGSLIGYLVAALVISALGPMFVADIRFHLVVGSIVVTIGHLLGSAMRPERRTA